MEILSVRKHKREYDLLKTKLSRGTAENDELMRFQELARILKSGRGKGTL